ncbi:DUF6632 domain-containing protein [Komarekiella delphini-convector]|uniref:DUF6632 domain-containing protein n=1 Tax=Komarekiella delphini-convector TaxID=3050158 RepID=UPI001CD8797B|nr:DUF6632 domain-containing protein [Komarekiella delphini-convector]
MNIYFSDRLALGWSIVTRFCPTSENRVAPGVYATLGVFLLLASRQPLANLSLIWFTVWSSLVHGLIMAVQAVIDQGERGHLFGDVPALLLVAIVLAFLTPRTPDNSPNPNEDSLAQT